MSKRSRAASASTTSASPPPRPPPIATTSRIGSPGVATAPCPGWPIALTSARTSPRISPRAERHLRRPQLPRPARIARRYPTPRQNRTLRPGRRLPRDHQDPPPRTWPTGSAGPPGAQTRACVDTAPVMEKELAARAGVGWIGKNTCIINERIGSWLLLGEVITTLDSPSTTRPSTTAAPARAASTPAPRPPSPRRTSSTRRRCISYLTIEHRGDIDSDLQPQHRRLALRLRHLPGRLPLEQQRADRHRPNPSAPLPNRHAPPRRRAELDGRGLSQHPPSQAP